MRENDIAFEVISRLWRRQSSAGFHVPRPVDIVGVITKEHVADAVAGSIHTYQR